MTYVNDRRLLIDDSRTQKKLKRQITFQMVFQDSGAATLRDKDGVLFGGQGETIEEGAPHELLGLLGLQVER